MFNEEWLKENLLNKPLYQTAFTHRSFLNESSDTKQSNERLEFLGDAILSLIMSSYLYTLRPQDDEGDLTSLRSYIVKTTSLAQAGENLKLGSFLKLSKGEELSGGRDNVQLLANTFEALLGAIYLEEGLEVATKFVHETLLPLFKKELVSGPPKDAKSSLQEITQNQTKQSPKYKILNTTGPDHDKEFNVGVYLKGELIGQGVGHSKQSAEEAAAATAIQRLTIND